MGLSSGRFLGCSVPELPGWESLEPLHCSQAWMLQITGLKLQAVRHLCLFFKHLVNKAEEGRDGWRWDKTSSRAQAPYSCFGIVPIPSAHTGHGALPLPATPGCTGTKNPACTGTRNPAQDTPPRSWALESPHAKSLHITSEAIALRCKQKIKRKFFKIQPKGLRLSRSPQIQNTTCPSHPDFGVQFWGWLCFPQVPQQKHPSRVQYLGEKFPTMLPNSPRIVSMQPSTLERCRRL